MALHCTALLLTACSLAGCSGVDPQGTVLTADKVPYTEPFVVPQRKIICDDVYFAWEATFIAGGSYPKEIEKRIVSETRKTLERRGTEKSVKWWLSALADDRGRGCQVGEGHLSRYSLTIGPSPKEPGTRVGIVEVSSPDESKVTLSVGVLERILSGPEQIIAGSPDESPQGVAQFVEWLFESGRNPPAYPGWGMQYWEYLETRPSGWTRCALQQLDEHARAAGFTKAEIVDTDEPGIQNLVFHYADSSYPLAALTVTKGVDEQTEELSLTFGWKGLHLVPIALLACEKTERQPAQAD